MHPHIYTHPHTQNTSRELHHNPWLPFSTLLGSFSMKPKMPPLGNFCLRCGMSSSEAVSISWIRPSKHSFTRPLARYALLSRLSYETFFLTVCYETTWFYIWKPELIIHVKKVSRVNSTPEY